MAFVFLLVSTLSIPISPVTAVSDLDSDGISDDLDLCPNLQEDYVGDEDGCPSSTVNWTDTVSDGISDDLDNCPNQSETYNQFKDEDGCPDSILSEFISDKDGDSILDLKDKWPLNAETYNGFHPLQNNGLRLSQVKCQGVDLQESFRKLATQQLLG